MDTETLIQLAKETVVADRYFSQMDVADRVEMGVTLANYILDLHSQEVDSDDEEFICKQLEIDRDAHRKEVGD